MKVVAENTENDDLARREAVLKVQSALRELAANLMRTVQGAGAPGRWGSRLRSS